MSASVTYVRRGQNGETLWQVPGWHRHAFVSNDGQYVVIGYAGANLVPVDVSNQEVMLSFYGNGLLIGTVTLGEWFPDPAKIPGTASHRHWGNVERLTDDNRLHVVLSDGQRIAYDITTGKLVREGP